MLTRNEAKIKLIQLFKKGVNTYLNVWVRHFANGTGVSRIYFKEYDLILILEGQKSSLGEVDHYDINFIDYPSESEIDKSVSIEKERELKFNSKFELKYTEPNIDLLECSYTHRLTENLDFEINNRVVDRYISLNLDTNIAICSKDLESDSKRIGFYSLATSALSTKTVSDFLEETTLLNSKLKEVVDLHFILSKEFSNQYFHTLAWFEIMYQGFTYPAFWLLFKNDKSKYFMKDLVYVSLWHNRISKDIKNEINLDGKTVYEILRIPVGFEFILDEFDFEKLSFYNFVELSQKIRQLQEFIPQLTRQDFEEYQAFNIQTGTHEIEAAFLYLRRRGFTNSEIKRYTREMVDKQGMDFKDCIYKLYRVLSCYEDYTGRFIKCLPTHLEVSYVLIIRAIKNRPNEVKEKIYQNIRARYQAIIDDKSIINVKFDEDSQTRPLGMNLLTYTRKNGKIEYTLPVIGDTVFIPADVKPSKKEKELFEKWAKEHQLLCYFSSLGSGNIISCMIHRADSRLYLISIEER